MEDFTDVGLNFSATPRYQKQDRPKRDSLGIGDGLSSSDDDGVAKNGESVFRRRNRPRLIPPAGKSRSDIVLVEELAEVLPVMKQNHAVNKDANLTLPAINTNET